MGYHNYFKFTINSIVGNVTLIGGGREGGSAGGGGGGGGVGFCGITLFVTGGGGGGIIGLGLGSFYLFFISNNFVSSFKTKIWISS